MPLLLNPLPAGCDVLNATPEVATPEPEVGEEAEVEKELLSTVAPPTPSDFRLSLDMCFCDKVKVCLC